MNFKRSERVSELLRHEISQMVQEIKDPRLGFITITGVRLSDDLMDAKVFFSVLGSDEDRKLNSEILTRSVPSIRHRLGRKLESLRKVPVLDFVYDETPARAQRVLSILNQLATEHKPSIDEQPSLPSRKSKNATQIKRKRNPSSKRKN